MEQNSVMCTLNWSAKIRMENKTAGGLVSVREGSTHHDSIHRWHTRWSLMNTQDSLSNVKISTLALRSGLPRCESGSESGNGTGSGSESGGENIGEILCCGVGSSCVIHSCSCFDCGYESESDRSWGSEGRPSSHGYKQSHPEHKHEHTSPTIPFPVIWNPHTEIANHIFSLVDVLVINKQTYCCTTTPIHTSEF